MKPQTVARGTAGIALGVFAALTAVLGGDVDATWFRPASIAATITGFSALGLEWFAPRLVLARRLFRLPDIHGTWAAVIRPTHVPNGVEAPQEIPAYVAINHRLSDITVNLFTEENVSHSTSAAITNANGLMSLTYTYHGEPRDSMRDRSPIHDGATRLKVLPGSGTLEGHYWTARLSRGELALTRRLKSKPVQGFAACAALDDAQRPDAE